MRGIILTSDFGTSLYPITKGICKQLLPIYDKPLIYYPLSVLMLAGIREILIVTNVDYKKQLETLLGDGTELGCKFEFLIPSKPSNILDIIIMSKKFIGIEKIAIIMGDSIYYSNKLKEKLNEFTDIDGGGIFASEVNNPEEYFIVELNDNNILVSIEERPVNPKSNLAITGLFFYDNLVVDIAKKIKKTSFITDEITSINNEYLKKGKLRVSILGRGAAWFETKTFDSLSNASDFVRIIEKRQSTKIGCIEEIAWRMGYITKERLQQLSQKYNKSGYGKYLQNLK